MNRMDFIIILGFIVDIAIVIAGISHAIELRDFRYIWYTIVAIFTVNGLLTIIFEIHKSNTLND